MIRVEDIRAYYDPKARSKVEPNKTATELDEAERNLLDYLDGTVEAGIYAEVQRRTVDGQSPEGLVVDIKIPKDFAPPNVITALRERWENGLWSVGVFFVHNDAGEIIESQVVFALPRSRNAQLAEPTQDGTPSVLELIEDNRREALQHAQDTRRAALRSGQTRPRVLLVSDVPNWAFDVNMHDLAETLADAFDFEHFYTERWLRGERPDWRGFDVIYEAYHRNPLMGIPMDRALGALRSQWFKPETPALPTAEDVALVNRYRGFQVAARRNYEELRESCRGVVYLTNPVNTTRFSHTPEKDTLVAAWSGNARHKSPDGRFIKRFYDIVQPSCMRAGIPLVAAEYGTTEGPMKRRMPADMPDFYQQANVCLCASEYEAASNSVMEAMASGLALLATDVGNHRELRDAQVAAFGDSGIILVERDVRAFTDALRSLTPQRAREMGAINRAEITARWSWAEWKDAYATFLRMAL